MSLRSDAPFNPLSLVVFACLNLVYTNYSLHIFDYTTLIARVLNRIMNLTPYHAKYYAFELTRRYAANSLQKFTASLSDAQVDLNPHQVDAALFAFQSPLSKGALLADEVGLGKTIEAGIVIAQKWAERKRKILIIAPANLRKQWNQEMSDKFFLPSIYLKQNLLMKSYKRQTLIPSSIVKKDAILPPFTVVYPETT